MKCEDGIYICVCFYSILEFVSLQQDLTLTSFGLLSVVHLVGLVHGNFFSFLDHTSILVLVPFCSVGLKWFSMDRLQSCFN